VVQAPDSETPVFRSPIRDRNGGLLDVGMAVSGQIPVTAESVLAGSIGRTCSPGVRETRLVGQLDGQAQPAHHRGARADVTNRLDGFLWGDN